MLHQKMEMDNKGHIHDIYQETFIQEYPSLMSLYEG